MGKYKIADLNVFIENGGMKTEQRGKNIYMIMMGSQI